MVRQGSLGLISGCIAACIASAAAQPAPSSATSGQTVQRVEAVAECPTSTILAEAGSVGTLLPAARSLMNGVSPPILVSRAATLLGALRSTHPGVDDEVLVDALEVAFCFKVRSIGDFTEREKTHVNLRFRAAVEALLGRQG